MLNWYKNRAIIFFGCALVGMLLLAASVSQILYTPENFISSSQESGLPLRSVDRIVFRGQERLMVLFYILLILALLSILLTPEGRRRLVFFLGILALLFIFTSAPKNTAETIATQMPSVTSAPTQAIEENAFIPQPVVEDYELKIPPWLVTVFGMALSLLIVGSLAMLVFIISQRRPAFSAPVEIAQQAEAAVEALEAGEDFHDTVIQCYAQMQRVLEQERGLVRDKTMTAREFQQILLKIGFPQEAVRALTDLFEAVRYGAHPAGESGVQKAITSLNAIIIHCKAMG